MRKFALITILTLSSLHPFKAKASLVNLLQITLFFKNKKHSQDVSVSILQLVGLVPFCNAILLKCPSVLPNPIESKVYISICNDTHIDPISNKHTTQHYSILELILPLIGSSSRILLLLFPPIRPSSLPAARVLPPSPRTMISHCRSIADMSVPPRFCPTHSSPHSA